MQPVAMGKTVACPHCRQEIFNDPDLAGTVVACPACQGQFTLPARMTEPPARMVEPPPVGVAYQRTDKPRWAYTALPIALGGFSAAIGVALSQFAPVFGGFFERSMAEPFSPARLSLVPVHLLGFAVAGAAIGGFIAFVMNSSKS